MPPSRGYIYSVFGRQPETVKAPRSGRGAGWKKEDEMISYIITTLVALPTSILALVSLIERFSRGKGRHRKR
nr:MAG TPA: hypothetical protein [Caudoviricetes sp.]